jgi:hypothetical protein
LPIAILNLKKGPRVPQRLRAIALASLLVGILAAPLPVAAETDAETPLTFSVGFGVGRGDQTGGSGFTSSYLGVAEFESGDFPTRFWRLDLEASGLSLGECELDPTLFVHTGFTGNFEPRDGGHVTNAAPRPPVVVGLSEVLVDWYIGPGVQLSLPLPLVERRLRVKPSVVMGLQSVKGTVRIDETSLLMNGGVSKNTKTETIFYVGPTLELNVPVVSRGRWGLSAYMSGNASFFVGDRRVSVTDSGQAGEADYSMKMDRFAWAYHGGIRLEFGTRGQASRSERPGD